jgi:hypothetical protein
VTDRQGLAGGPEAIFIVGVNRSGTTLMRTILERSPQIAIARENHFLGHIRASEGARYYFRRAGDLRDDATVRRIVELLYGGEFARRSRWRELSPFWKWLIAEVPRDEVERQLLAAERTERGMFVAFLRIYADHMGKPIIGEKTPTHLDYVDTLLEWFPDGRVIHMLRDPRAVFVSDLRRRRGKLRRPYKWFARIPGLLPLVILVQTTVVWRAAARRQVVYARRYPDRFRMVKFEDLVAHPDETLRATYQFLGVDMPAGATEVKVVSAGFNRGEQGFDAGAATRWRDQINPLARRWLELGLAGPMRSVGYPNR